MPKGEAKLAKELGTSRETIKNLSKKKGNGTGELTAEVEEEIRNEVAINQKLKADNLDKVEMLKQSNAKFKPKVRRIDKQAYSSMHDVLKDAKDRYVANEEIIQKLQNEINNQDVMMNGNINGTVSIIPQLTSIERFIKLNIALRNQIIEIEAKIGIDGKESEDDPFN